MIRRFLIVTVLVIVAACAPSAGAAEPPTREQEVLSHLSEVAAWYQHVVSLEQGQASPGEVLFRDAVGRTSRQALDQGFEFARAEAARAEAARANGGGGPTTAPATAGAAGGPATSASPSARGRRLEQAAAVAGERAAQLRTELDALERQIAAAPQPADPALAARRERLASELNLATVRRDVLQRLSTFRDEPAGGGEGTLLDQVEALQRSIPAVPGQEAAAVAAAAAAGAGASAAPAAARAEASGVFALSSQMFELSRRMRELKELAEQAAALRQANDRLRAPLRAELMAAVRRADAVAATRPAAGAEAGSDAAQSNDAAQPNDVAQPNLDALAAQFKRLSDAAVPLGRQSVLLDQARASLVDWRGLLGRQYYSVLRALLLRLGVTGAVIAGIFAVSVAWRRATFRYVHDPRRRRQFMLLRRLAIAGALVVVGVFSFVTEFGSIATFAGILTAGIAVSLQTLILSGVAYFFFVGRYGVRVGDRVTVAGVTGDVVDTGLFRLYLTELGGPRRLEPTGRVVVFANSVLFQPSGFFKQVPGADYVWHEISLTLSPESDHRLAERRLMAAVESVFADYREAIDRQHAAARRSGAAPAAPPRPGGRLRFVESGLEFTIRYPVEISRAAEAEDRLTRSLLAAIEEEPRLKLVAATTPVIQGVGERR
jgi:small-conductance mechanosensitive channel